MSPTNHNEQRRSYKQYEMKEVNKLSKNDLRFNVLIIINW